MDNKYSVEKVKEYLGQFYNNHNYIKEFYIALLIRDRLDLSIQDVSEDIVEKVGNIYNSYGTIYNEDLNYNLQELEEELNEQE